MTYNLNSAPTDEHSPAMQEILAQLKTIKEAINVLDTQQGIDLLSIKINELVQHFEDPDNYKLYLEQYPQVQSIIEERVAEVINVLGGMHHAEHDPEKLQALHVALIEVWQTIIWMRMFRDNNYSPVVSSEGLDATAPTIIESN